MATNESKSFSFQGQKVSYLKQGRGPAAVIVHGLGGHKEDFTQVMDLLAPALTVYAFDMLGFGASSRDSASVGIGTQADVIKALADAEGHAKVHAVGNSLGAWVAATFAAKHAGSVDRLVLIDAAGLKITLSGPPPVNFAPDTVEEMHNLLHATIASPFAQTTEFATKALAAFKASGEAATLGRLFAGFASADNKDRVLDDVLPDVKAKTLVVWGEKDGLFPAALADVVAGGVKGSRKILIPNASHFPQVDDPKALAETILTFLA